MLSRIRKRLTYTNVALTLALVFAMSGGAYAASKYVITSTKQIKPSVLKQLQGKAGAQGPVGAQGPAGPAGATGLAGAAGVKGETGTTGPEGPPGKNGENGKNGTTGFTKVLPKGETETGTWSVVLKEGQTLIPLSFSIPLAQQLEGTNVHIAPNKECPGTAEEPKAEAGNLCVYIGADENIELSRIAPPYELGISGTGRSGAVVFVGSSAKPGESGLAVGTWAVTAPE
jgi:hypothetical protein